MNNILASYFKTVEEVTGEKDDQLFEHVKKLIECEFLKITQTRTKGIVVGTFNSPTSRSSNLYISTGTYEECDNSESKLIMLHRLEMLTNVPGIIFLRVPLIASLHKTKTEDLINAFKPIIGYFFKSIMRQSVNNNYEELIYILALGKNSRRVVTECFEYINRPRFILIQTVHPNNMREMDQRISEAKTKEERMRLIKRKNCNLDIFEQGFKVFLNYVVT